MNTYIHSYFIPWQNKKSSKHKVLKKKKKKKENKAAHNSRHNTINSKHNQNQYLCFTYLQLRKVWTGVFSFADHFSTKLKRSNHKYIYPIHCYEQRYVWEPIFMFHRHSVILDSLWWQAVKCHVKRHCTEKYKLNPLAILKKAIYFNQLAAISYRFHLISNNNNIDMHSKMTPPFFSKVTDMTHIHRCQ